MKTPSIFVAQVLGTFPKQDPNEIALHEFREWMRSHGMDWEFANEFTQHLMNVWIVLPAACVHTFSRCWNEMLVVHEDARPAWSRFVHVDPRTKKIFFQRKLCVYCDRLFAEHANGKCLFSSTSFEIPGWHREKEKGEK